MGAAAYNRGSMAIRESIDRDIRPAEFEMMDALNAIPKAKDAGLPFGPTEIVPGNGGVWHACPETGFGWWYASVREVMKNWGVSVVGINGNRFVCTPNNTARHHLLR